MDIQLRFADGSTELRDAESPCLPALFDPPPRHPSDGRWYLYFPNDKHPFSFCGITVRTLTSQRGWGETYIWRITGRDDVSKALTGGWQSCQVETTDEQIERVTRERDVEQARRKLAEHALVELEGRIERLKTMAATLAGAKGTDAAFAVGVTKAVEMLGTPP